MIRHWNVPDLDHADVVRRSRRYVEENNVHLLPDAELNENNKLFVTGCEKAGYKAEPFPLNVKCYVFTFCRCYFCS